MTPLPAGARASSRGARNAPGEPGAQAVVGWREWLLLPDLCDVPIKAKVDTGARTSAVHAFGLRIENVEGIQVASFELHPRQRSKSGAVRVQCPIRGFRRVRSSNGRTETRPVIMTSLQLGEHRWNGQLTLTSRDAMGFRILLGRSALKGRFLVDPSRSFAQSRSIERAMRGQKR